MLQIAVKSLSALFVGKASKNNGDFICLNCLHSCRTKNNLTMHENVCKNDDCCYIEMAKKESILNYNHGEKSMKNPFIVYTDMESLLEKINTCCNDK